MSMASLEDYRTPRPWLALAVFLVVVLGVGFFIGTQSSPGAWFEGLDKPWFNPPAWVFAPVWTVIYILIAVAGWRIWTIEARSPAMMVWFAQMLLNWAWSPTFFGAQQLWLSLAVILALWVLIVAFIVVARKYDSFAVLLFVPYLAWVSFASVLNWSIAVLN
jgi:tryptophan-rich sensory protein